MIPLHDHFVREVSVNAAKKELSLHTAYPLAALFAENLSQRSRNRGDRGGAGLLAVTRTPGEAWRPQLPQRLLLGALCVSALSARGLRGCRLY